MQSRIGLVLVGLAAGALAACSGDSNGDDVEENGVDLEPPASDEGVQLRMESTLEAGHETERCMFYTVPEEGLWVQRQVVRYTPGSHHVLLYTTPYSEIPEEDSFGDAVDTSGVFECGEYGPTAHWEVDGVAGGAQAADGPPIVGGLPEDTALYIPGGSVLLMNTHYLNASDQPLETDARINLYTVPEDQVEQEAGILFFYNPFIRVPGKKSATAREVCPIHEDIALANAQSHMHKRGVGFQAKLLDAEGETVEELYSGSEWEDVVMDVKDPSLEISAGHFIDFRCEYDNEEDRTVMQGLRTTDEMCMFIGLYYPRHRQTELCGLNDDWSGRFMGARWIGDGSAGGAETASCFNKAKSADEDGGDSFYRCVVDSCPEISAPMSDVARCLATSAFGECEDVACLETACAEDFQTLAAATCED